MRSVATKRAAGAPCCRRRLPLRAAMLSDFLACMLRPLAASTGNSSSSRLPARSSRPLRPPQPHANPPPTRELEASASAKDAIIASLEARLQVRGAGSAAPRAPGTCAAAPGGQCGGQPHGMCACPLPGSAASLPACPFLYCLQEQHDVAAEAAAAAEEAAAAALASAKEHVQASAAAGRVAGVVRVAAAGCLLFARQSVDATCVCSLCPSSFCSPFRSRRVLSCLRPPCPSPPAPRSRRWLLWWLTRMRSCMRPRRSSSASCSSSCSARRQTWR